MADSGFDFAVCGATPFALLLAGRLALGHGRRVCVVGEPWSPYRLGRRFDVSVMPATRPETWALLRNSGAETLKLLGSIGRGLYERVDPLFVAETPASVDYVGHMRWMAAGFGFAAERAIERGLTAGGTICRIRDAAMLVPGRAEPVLEGWLAKAGIRHLSARTTIAFRRDAPAELTFGGQTATAATVVLADDDAILTHLPAGDRGRVLQVLPAASVLTDPARSLPAALIRYLDRDVTVHQRAGRGPIAAIAAGDPETATARLGASLRQEALRAPARAVFRTIETADGAPLVGRTGKSRAVIAAALGMSAAFLAPAVARFLAAAASEEETRYFTAREPARAAARPAVAESARAPVALESAS